MVYVIKSTPTLYDALKAQGIEMPQETVDVRLDFPLDGPARLTFVTNLYGERMAAFGRALGTLSGTLELNVEKP
jgi:hypothetical protein